MKPRHCLFLLLFLLSAIAEAQLPAAIPYRKGTKWGLCDSTKRMLVQPVYRSVRFLDDRYGVKNASAELFFLVEDSASKYGVVNGNGDWIVPMGAREIQRIQHYFQVSDGTHWGTYSSTGKIQAPFHYSQMIRQLEKNEIVDSAGYWGLLDSTGKVVLPCRAWRFQDDYPTGLIKIFTDTKKADHPSGYYDPVAQRMIIEPVYDDIVRYDSLLHLNKGSRWALADLSGRMILPLAEGRIDGSEHTDSVFYRIYKKRHGHYYYSLTARGGKPWATDFIPQMSRTQIDLHDPLKPVQRGKKWGLYDLATARMILPVEYDTIGILSYNPTVFLAKKDGYFGTIDSTGRSLAPLRFETIHYDWPSHLLIAHAHDTDYVLRNNGSIDRQQPFALADGGGETPGRINNLSYDGKNYIFPHGTFRSLTLTSNYCWLTETQSGMHGVLDNKGQVLLPDTFPETINTTFPTEARDFTAPFYHCLAFRSPSGNYLYQLYEHLLTLPFDRLQRDWDGEPYNSRSRPNGDYISTRGKLHGLISGEGTERIPTKYRSIETPKNLYEPVRLAYYVEPGHGDWCDVDVYLHDTLCDHLRDSFCYVRILSAQDHLYAVQNQFHQTGVIGKDGKHILPMKYGSIYITRIGSKKFLEVVPSPVADVPHLLFDTNGKPLLSGQGFTRTNESLRKFLLVRIDSNIVLLDSNGQEKTRFRAERVDRINDTLLQFARNGKWGVTTVSGKVLVPAAYDYIYQLNHDNFQSPYLIVRSNQTVYTYDLRTGQPVPMVSVKSYQVFSGSLFLGHSEGYFSASGISYWED